jgi:hypothetical protein
VTGAREEQIRLAPNDKRVAKIEKEKQGNEFARGD